MYLYLDIYPFGERLLQAFSWMLVHSLWQGMLLALLTVLLLQLTRKAASSIRYHIVLVNVIAFVATGIITFFRELAGNVSQKVVPLADSIGQGASTLFRLDAMHVKLFTANSAGFISANAHLLVIVWALFFTFRSVRMVQGMIYLRNARLKKIYAAPEEWRERLQALCLSLGITKTVRLLESATVKVPLAAGHLKPVILIPAGLLTGLPAAQIEAVLLHELAHIRRHDYIVNLLQVCLETIFFFNPGLLWISALLRDEREHCCDDIALQQTGSKKAFVQALISFKEYTLNRQYPAVAFPGNKNQLLQRISRIVNDRRQSLGTAEKVLFFTGIAMLSVVLSTAAITQLARHTTSKINTPYLVAKGEQIVPPVALDRTIPDNLSPVVTKMPSVTVTRHTPITTVASRNAASPEVMPSPQPAPATMINEEVQVEESSTSTAMEQARRDRKEKARRQQEQLRRDKEQAERDKCQATLDRIQAEKDRQQATLDRLQADRDREQARLDRLQSLKDRQQADRDRAQAEKDRQQANIDRANAEKERTAVVPAVVKSEVVEKTFYTTRYTDTYRNTYNNKYNANRQPDNVQ